MTNFKRTLESCSEMQALNDMHAITMFFTNYSQAILIASIFIVLTFFLVRFILKLRQQSKNLDLIYKQKIEAKIAALEMQDIGKDVGESVQANIGNELRQNIITGKKQDDEQEIEKRIEKEIMLKSTNLENLKFKLIINSFKDEKEPGSWKLNDLLTIVLEEMYYKYLRKNEDLLHQIQLFEADDKEKERLLSTYIKALLSTRGQVSR